MIIIILIAYPLFWIEHACIKPLPREGRTGQRQLRTQIRGVRAQPALVSHYQKVTSQVHPASSSALPAPRLLGDVVNEGATVEAQLITLLGFVVIQSFHSSLRLSGENRKEKVRPLTWVEGSVCIHWRIWFFSLGSRGFSPGLQRHLLAKHKHCGGSTVSKPPGSTDGDWPGQSQGHPKSLNFLNKKRICLWD